MTTTAMTEFVVEGFSDELRNQNDRVMRTFVRLNLQVVPPAVVGVAHWATQEENASGKTAPGPGCEVAATGRSAESKC